MMIKFTEHQIILTADYSLMTEFREIALFGFLSCSPKQFVPEILYDHLFAPLVPSMNGEAKFAQYSLRKVEATLLRDGYDVVVATPNHVEKFIGDSTEIIGLTVMDPLGIGPVTSSFRLVSNSIPYNHYKFLKLLKRIKGKSKIVVGGQGAWQFHEETTREKYGIDHVLIGEFEKEGNNSFKSIIDGDAPPIIYMRSPTVDEIPSIRGASINSLVEISRGCGRMCKFCSPTLAKKRDIPIERIIEESKLNHEAGKSNSWLHAEDALLYGCHASDFQPDRDAVLEMFKEVVSVEGINGAGFTHLSLAAVAADPELIGGISSLCKTSPDHWTSVQPGIETGSPEVIRKGMANKVKPFQPDEWPDVVRDSIDILNKNYWIPACTIIVGSPYESQEDVQETIELVDSLEDKLCILAPLMYTDIGEEDETGLKNYKDLNPQEKELFYKCWRHSFKLFIDQADLAFKGFNPIMGTVLKNFVKLGSNVIIRRLDKDWG